MWCFVWDDVVSCGASSASDGFVCAGEFILDAFAGFQW